MRSLKNEKVFFDYVRETIFKGSISANQVSGLKAILAACGNNSWPQSHTAYALATAYHETAATMKPIGELGGPVYFTKLYDITGKDPERAKKNGNTKAGDGPRYKGRGYVQLTWKNNYKLAGNKLGVDLVNNPELALDPDIAAKILISGMSEGWFRGVTCVGTMPKSLASKEEFIKARGIINKPSDDPILIAGYATHFQKAIELSGW